MKLRQTKTEIKQPSNRRQEADDLAPTYRDAATNHERSVEQGISRTNDCINSTNGKRRRGASRPMVDDDISNEIPTCKLSKRARRKIEDIYRLNDLIAGRRADDPHVYEWRFPQGGSSYWLHVTADGTERRYDRLPIGAMVRETLRIDVKDGFETTITSNLVHYGAVSLTYTTVRPRGEGWVKLDTSSDKWTSWRRERRATTATSDIMTESEK